MKKIKYNVLNLISLDLNKHRVLVTLPGESEERLLGLIIVTAETSLSLDIGISYLDISKTQMKMRDHLFGTELQKNDYGMFIDLKDLRYIFAFNVAFARYDEKNKKVVYDDLDNFLIKNFQKLSKEKLPVKDDELSKIIKRTEKEEKKEKPVASFPAFYPYRSSAILKYAVTEANKKK